MSPITRRKAMSKALVAPLLAAAAQSAAKPWKVLLVVAHPDDEYYFAGTVYRLAQELNATVDQVIMTNGEGGYRYSSLAEKIYGVHLTDEATGRRRLPDIRKQETLAAGKILGIRHHFFLNERDQRFTLDAEEALDQVWDCRRIRQSLREVFARTAYDFVFTMLPRESTHGHHQAATLLALEVVKELDNRPVVLSAEPRAASDHEAFEGLKRFSLATPVNAQPDFVFNRHQSFGFHDALRYDIVVNWVIAEHKSQGLFQNDCGKHDVEQFWRFALGPADAEARTQALAKQLQPL